jgi:hypothetical protein
MAPKRVEVGFMSRTGGIVYLERIRHSFLVCLRCLVCLLTARNIQFLLVQREGGREVIGLGTRRGKSALGTVCPYLSQK